LAFPKRRIGGTNFGFENWEFPRIYSFLSKGFREKEEAFSIWAFFGFQIFAKEKTGVRFPHLGPRPPGLWLSAGEKGFRI